MAESQRCMCPSVDVCVTTLGYSQCVSRAVCAILKQTAKPMIARVVDAKKKTLSFSPCTWERPEQINHLLLRFERGILLLWPIIIRVNVNNLFLWWRVECVSVKAHLARLSQSSGLGWAMKLFSMALTKIGLSPAHMTDGKAVCFGLFVY